MNSINLIFRYIFRENPSGRLGSFSSAFATNASQVACPRKRCVGEAVQRSGVFLAGLQMDCRRSSRGKCRGEFFFPMKLGETLSNPESVPLVLSPFCLIPCINFQVFGFK